jgi:hypothetical protein
MNCRNTEKEMILSLSNDLDPHKQQILEAHLKDCSACSRKYEEIKKDLERMAALAGQRPEFDWDRSWQIIRTRVNQNSWTRERRVFRMRRVLQAAAVLGIFLLGIVIGRHLLLPPATDLSLRSPEKEVTLRLIQQHLEETGTALLEYDNRLSLASDRRIFDFEKQRARFLLFRNRTLQALLDKSADPSVAALLRDLEILLYEAANLEASSSENQAFIKALIKDKDIFFRIRQIGLYQASKADKEATL